MLITFIGPRPFSTNDRLVFIATIFIIFMLYTADESEVVGVHVGERATLNCSTPDPVDWWYQQSLNSSGQQICSSGLMVNGFQEDGRYSLRRSTPTDSSLVIYYATEHSSGFYTCKDSRRGVIRVVHLNVWGKDGTKARFLLP